MVSVAGLQVEVWSRGLANGEPDCGQWYSVTVFRYRCSVVICFFFLWRHRPTSHTPSDHTQVVSRVEGFVMLAKFHFTFNVYQTKSPWRNFLIKWKFFEDWRSRRGKKKVFLTCEKISIMAWIRAWKLKYVLDPLISFGLSSTTKSFNFVKLGWNAVTFSGGVRSAHMLLLFWCLVAWRCIIVSRGIKA